ncbi:MAG TPA: cytochrome c [Verrucomicrobiae bacterium]|nr:cytochrome c [Verrucomicrobiae bacterium]
MRYFLLIFGITVVAIMAIAGRRFDDGGAMSRKPPLYIFPDMDRQLKLRPQEPNAFFANGRSSQLPVPGTVAQVKPKMVSGQPVFPFEDVPVNTGHIAGTTNFVEVNPLPINAELLKRGRQRFAISCAPCHGATADGNGITKKIGAMAVVANLHDRRIVEMTDGELFHVITHGRNLMGPYGPTVPTEDRWAIIAYLRALQLSRLGTIDDVPQELRGTLTR